MNDSIILLRNISEPHKVLYYSIFGSSFIVNSRLDEVIPFNRKMNKGCTPNSSWEEIEFSDLTGDEMNFILAYADDEEALQLS